MAKMNLRRGAVTIALALAALTSAMTPIAAFAADEDQYLNSWRGAGSRLRSAQVLALTMTAGATVQGAITVPQGSWVQAVRLETPTAFSGSPTNINVTGGSTAAGTDYLAATDAKAQGHLSPSWAAAFDVVHQADSGSLVLNFQAAAVGGTNPAGTVNVIVDYSAPVH